MTTINPYIHFNGNAEQAFKFYQSIFGGEFQNLVRFKDMPIPGRPDPDPEADKIMHISLPIGEHNFLMGSDTPEFMGKHNENETRSKLFISAKSKLEADNIFNGLVENANVEMPIDNSPWGTYFGMLRDKYGLEWMVEYNHNQ
jgi:PhnB protein